MGVNNSYMSDEFGLTEKVILLTGGAGGLGEASAIALAKAGATIAVCDINYEKAKSVAMKLTNYGEAEAFFLNLLDLDSIKSCVKEVVDRFSRIDVLINAGGVAKKRSIYDVDEKTFDFIMGINLKGTFFMSQAAMPYLIRQRRGKIVNFSSYNEKGMLAGNSVYGATKAGISALTRSMAIELAEFNIQANAIAPGFIATEMNKGNVTHPLRGPWVEERIALRRWGMPDEITGMIIFLSSKASDYITGQTYHVDGGLTAGGAKWPDEDYNPKRKW